MSIATRTFQASFNGGELSPLLDSRPDAAIYRDGCRELQNCVVRPYGGAFKRPGLQYGGAVKTSSTATRLIPFKRSTSTNYVIEMGDSYMRFWKGGSAMTRITSGTPVEIASPYTAAQLQAVQFCQINDVMFLVHPSHAPRRLSRNSETSWTLEVFPFDFPPMSDINDTTTTIRIQPGVSAWATSTAYTVGQVRLESGLLYMCATAHTSGTFATDLAASRWKAVKPRGPWVRDDDHDTADMVDVNGTRYVCILSTAGLIAGSGYNANPRPGSGSGWATYWLAVGDSNLRLFASSSTFSAADVGTYFRIDVGCSKRSLFLSTNHTAGATHVTEPMFIAGDALIRSTITTTNYSGYLNGGVKGELYLEFSKDRSTWDRVRHWGFKNPADGNIASTYNGPSTGGYYRIRWEPGITSTARDQGFLIEATTGVVTALVKIDSYVSATEVTASFVLPDITFAPCEILTQDNRNWYRGAFGANYPRAVAFHEARLWFAGVSGDASRAWSSRVDDFYNFFTGPEDDDGIDITLSSVETNQIEWMASLGRNLVIGTTGEEWIINSGESDSVLTADNMRARLTTRNGSAPLAPQMVNDALFWCPRSARRLHEFNYDFSRDAWSGSDVLQFAEHLGASGLVDMDFAAMPDSVLWAVNGDGELCGFTYDRRQNVTAWHRHVTDGYFESVATIYGDNGRDEVWFVVRRTINGATVRNVERFYPTAQDFDFDTASDFFYVDSGLKVTPSGTSITGLSHLEGKEVKIWADGARIETKTVSSGAVTLSTAATSAIVGLAYEATLRPMRLEVVLDDGTGQGRHWRPNRLIACLYNSIGGEFRTGGDWTALDYSTPYEREQADEPALTVRTTRISSHVPADWEDSIELQFRSNDPVPFNLLAYILIHEVEGR